MKGQFFISGIVVIAVILIVSMSYATSAERLRIDSGTDLAFENYRNAYERAVPDDWEFVDYLSRNKVGICVPNSEFEAPVNTTVQFNVDSSCLLELNSSVEIRVDSVGPSCYILITPMNLSLDSYNCTDFYVYYDSILPDSDELLDGVPSYPVNGSKFYDESIDISPNVHLTSNYREKNIYVEETSDLNKIYNISYKSMQIEYTGEL